MTDDELLVAYLRRSYHAADGLWFLKVEEALGFDRTLELDVRVWEVLAKIQARQARSLLGIADNSVAEFARAFSLKLRADGFTFTSEVAETGARFTMSACPWLDLLRRAGREHLAAQISGVMCPTEGHAWCREFGSELAFSLESAMCQGGGQCRMVFARVEKD